MTLLAVTRPTRYPQVRSGMFTAATQRNDVVKGQGTSAYGLTTEVAGTAVAGNDRRAVNALNDRRGCQPRTTAKVQIGNAIRVGRSPQPVGLFRFGCASRPGASALCQHLLSVGRIVGSVLHLALRLMPQLGSTVPCPGLFDVSTALRTLVVRLTRPTAVRPLPLLPVELAHRLGQPTSTTSFLGETPVALRRGRGLRFRRALQASQFCLTRKTPRTVNLPLVLGEQRGRLPLVASDTRSSIHTPIVLRRQLG